MYLVERNAEINVSSQLLEYGYTYIMEKYSSERGVTGWKIFCDRMK
jgi:hypothetical protein